ncbi:MAG: hypothetical protein DWI21_16415 [Planctomycetota bacterium]|nr:MAG: hypothetical protein DWI21_16415 [Planctomycetota bacterium]
MPPLLSQISSAIRAAWWDLRPFRLLMIVYGMTITVSVWEISQQALVVDLYLDPHANFTDALTTLYPERGESQYAKVIQAVQCAEAQQLRRPAPATCRQYNPDELVHEVRSFFERGLGTGIKHHQGLYYEYLQFLVLTKAKPADIDAAYQAWRRNFPLSSLPDPRRSRR